MSQRYVCPAEYTISQNLKFTLNSVRFFRFRFRFRVSFLVSVRFRLSGALRWAKILLAHFSGHTRSYLVPFSLLTIFETFYTQITAGSGFTSGNCSRYWHVLDFDASTAKFKIHQNKLTTTAPTLPSRSSANPNCTCNEKTYGITSDDVITSATKLSETAESLMVEKLCVNEMKRIYKNARE